jgi:hypothetical protein
MVLVFLWRKDDPVGDWRRQHDRRIHFAVGNQGIDQNFQGCHGCDSRFHNVTHRTGDPVTFHNIRNALYDLLGIATYVIGTAAGVKLLRSVIGKTASTIACVLCVGAYPFVGTAISIPIVVGACCLIFVAWRQRMAKRMIDAEIDV